MMSRKTLLFSLILLIGAGLSIILMVTRERASTTDSSPRSVNAFMVDPVYREFNKAGKLHSRLYADKMQHINQQDTSIFTNPRILLYTDNRIPWYVSSKYGRSKHGTTDVLLYQNVVLHQPQKPDHPETTIHTSELNVYPNRSFAETDKKVEIQQPGSTIHGKGLQANFKTGKIKLLSQSQGSYNPSKSQY